MKTVPNKKIVYYLSTEIFMIGMIVTLEVNLGLQAYILSLFTFLSFLVLSDFIINAKNLSGAANRLLGNEWK